MPVCTMPKIPWFRDWYNREFKDLCEAHDDAYRNKRPRKSADIQLMIGIAYRGYPALGIATYVSVRTFGWINYWRAK